MAITEQRTANRFLRSLLGAIVLVGWCTGLRSEELPLGSHETLVSFPEVGIDEECREQFLKEGPNGWKFIRDNLRGL